MTGLAKVLVATRSRRSPRRFFSVFFTNPNHGFSLFPLQPLQPVGFRLSFRSVRAREGTVNLDLALLLLVAVGLSAAICLLLWIWTRRRSQRNATVLYPTQEQNSAVNLWCTVYTTPELAAPAAEHLLHELDPEAMGAWPQKTTTIRESLSSSWIYNSEPQEITNAVLRNIITLGHSGPAFIPTLGILSVFPSGYVREAAVRQLTSSHSATSSC